MIANMDNNSNFALLTAIKQAGVKLKVVNFPAGFDQSLVGSNVWSTLQGAYFGSSSASSRSPTTRASPPCRRR